MFPFLKFLEAYAPFEDFYKCRPYVLIEIINYGAHTHYCFCMPWELLVALARCREPSLAGQSSYWPGFQQKQYSNQHVPIECFRFQQSNIFLWKSLSSGKIPAVKKLPMPGAQWHNKVSCWFCLQRKNSLLLALSGNQVPLAIKIASTSMGEVGFDQRWLPVPQELNTILHQFSHIQVQQAVSTSFALCSGAQMPQCQGLCFGERWIVHWMNASELVPLDPVLCICCK